MHDPIGRTLGKYRVLEQLGAGGMATVYKAYDPAMDRSIAIKVPSAHLLQDPQFRTRFQGEARTIAKLEHPHILPVYDFGEEQGVPYLVMRYVDGGTLRDRLSRGVLPLDQALRLVAEVGDALAYAHGKGVIHRDVKPANVLLDHDGSALLTDFGIAKLVEQTMQLTQGVVLGTPQYMAPEQVTGKSVDARTDIYALGVVLYELLTGRRPFEGDTPFAVAFMHVTDPFPPPRQVNPALPEAAERIILKAMARDPADRYPSASDFARELHRLLADLENAAEDETLAAEPTLPKGVAPPAADGQVGAAPKPPDGDVAAARSAQPPLEPRPGPAREVQPDAGEVGPARVGSAQAQSGKQSAGIGELLRFIAKQPLSRGPAKEEAEVPPQGPQRIWQAGVAALVALVFLGAAMASSSALWPVAAAYLERGYADENQGKLDLALADYSQAIKLDPSNGINYNNRAFFYESQGKLDLALADWSQAIKVDPSNGNFYYERGLLYRRENQPTQAIADFRKYLELNPTNPNYGDRSTVQQWIAQMQ